MASTGTALIFARIVPEGVEAEDALDSVCNYEHLDDNHRSFIHIEAGPRVRHGDSGSDSSQSNRQPPPNHHSTGAYFTLSLQQTTIQPFSKGWRLGRDTAEVDLLLIRPGKPRRQVAPVHARIRLHVRSGVLMLFGVDSNRSVLYRLHDSAKPLLLSDGRGHVLYQRSNSFSVGQLHYTLEFADFNHDLYRRFVDERNRLLNAFGLPDPHPALSAICRFQDTKRGLTITHGTLSTGKFGIVSAGVTTEYGEPVAIKQHRADNPHDMRRIRREADIGALFKLQQGLMPTLSVWCEHQSAGVCNQIPQAIFTSSPLALCDFTRVLWSDYSLTVIRECLRGVMRGLVTLHTAGFMHRDIHKKNVFLVSSDPPAAVLGDFGKTVQAESHSDDCLGPIHTRAPEVDGRTQYTNKIDVWSLGIVLLSILDRDAQPPGGQIPTLQWHQPVMEYCTRVKRDKNGTLDADVADLIQQMLTWDLNARPTARQISEHPYFTSSFSNDTIGAATWTSVSATSLPVLELKQLVTKYTNARTIRSETSVVSASAAWASTDHARIIQAGAPTPGATRTRAAKAGP
ncbi:MAG: hypothetical protein LQ341_005185 [Variospora aurantia]|nr:MAG: hypothetical protein LQ341_005185 [Variospora aurantia]